MTLLQPAASAAAVAAIMAGRPELLGSADSLLGHVEAWLQPVGCGIMTIHYLQWYLIVIFKLVSKFVSVWLETLVYAMD